MRWVTLRQAQSDFPDRHPERSSDLSERSRGISVDKFYAALFSNISEKNLNFGDSSTQGFLPGRFAQNDKIIG